MRDNERFSEHLMSGETVLWQGEGRSGGIFTVAVWLLWTGFAAIYITACLKNYNSLWLMGIPFAVFGIFSLLGCMKKIYYSVTDRRILVLNGSRLKVYYLAEITDIEIKLQGERGRIKFGTKCLTKDAGEEGYYRVTGEMSGIKDPKEAFDILNAEIYRLK